MADDENEEAWTFVTNPTDGVAIDVPEPPTPGADLDESEASHDLFVAFWSIVLTLNAAVLAVCLGPLLAFFNGRVRLGAGLFVLGLLGFGFAYYKYRRFQRQNRDEPGVAERADA